MAFKTLPQTFSLLYKNDKKYLLIMLLEVVAFSIDKYPALLIMKYTIDALTNNIAYSDYVWVIIPLIAIMFILKMIRVIINTSRPCRDQVITENLFNAFFAQCMKIDYQTLESKEIQDKKELAKFIANGKIAAIGWYFVEMFSSLIALIIATIFMIRINIIVLVIVILGLLVNAFLAKKHSDKTVPVTKQQIIENRYLSYLYGVGSDYEHVKEFRIFHYKKNLYEKINAEKEKHIKTNDKLLKYNFIHSTVHNVEDFIIKLMSFGIMGFSCLKSIVTISDFTFIIGLVNDYISYSNSFTTSCKSYVEAAAYIEHYIEFMNYKSILSLSEESSKHISIQSHVIEFQNVYFKYPNSNDYALKNVSLKLHIPMKISLVGRNGAGKSTLIKLLLRLYKPDEGQIMIDGVSIYEYSNEEYSMLFSLVFQDFVLFAFSVSDNITSFDTNIDQHFFSNISNETGVVDFICNYPNRYETYFSNAYSNDGVEFSGGEQQKIALARSIYKENALFFVLDEPTSTYDADAEYQLYKKYEKILFDKASIFISHRLSSCKLSDHIILLDNGMVIEEGSHNELMKNETQYRRMFELQANQYNWEEDNND
jgi:ATP-binding cassette subfamily B protein/ATP-binding cassette subfamily C protein